MMMMMTRRLLPSPGFLELFLERSDSDLQPRLVLLCLIEESSGLVQLRLVHRLDLRRLFAPFRLQLLQLVRQLAILRLQETNLQPQFSIYKISAFSAVTLLVGRQEVSK